MNTTSIKIKEKTVASLQENAGIFRLVVFKTAKDLPHTFVSPALKPLADAVADAAEFPQTSRQRAEDLTEISKILTDTCKC
jgi:hypothetical protein